MTIREPVVTTIPATVAASTKEDATVATVATDDTSLAQIRAEDYAVLPSTELTEFRHEHITRLTRAAASSEETENLAQFLAESLDELIAFSGPRRVEDRHGKLFILLRRPPRDRSAYPVELRDCLVLSRTKPTSLTNLPDETWTQFYNEFEKKERVFTLQTFLIMLVWVAAGIAVVPSLLSVLGVRSDTLVLGVVAAYGFVGFAFLRWVFKRTERIRSQVVSDYGGRFEAAGYRLSIQEETFGMIGHLKIWPLATEG